MENWTNGYADATLQAAQERYGLVFPPDLIALLRERQPTFGYDWSTENSKIREMLEWPFELLKADVENGFWWPAWGERPPTTGERIEILREAVSRAPKLIPLYSHRFLPETPGEPGNPVFSMRGFDTIYYGANLAECFEREFGPHQKTPVSPCRHIPFWSDLVEGFDTAYAYYAADEANRAMMTDIVNDLRRTIGRPLDDQ